MSQNVAGKTPAEVIAYDKAFWERGPRLLQNFDQLKKRIEQHGEYRRQRMLLATQRLTHMNSNVDNGAPSGSSSNTSGTKIGVLVPSLNSQTSSHPIRTQVTTSAQPSQPNTSENAAPNGPSLTKTPATTVKTLSTLEKANEFKTRGNDCVKVGQFQKAIHYYTEAIRLNKFDAIYFSNRAHCYLKLNRYLECVEDCTIAIGMDANCVKAYYRRMQAYEKLDGVWNFASALADCETVLRFEPKNDEAKKCMARIKSA